jgi:hypothetical protein
VSTADKLPAILNQLLGFPQFFQPYYEVVFRNKLPPLPSKSSRFLEILVMGFSHTILHNQIP